MIMEAGRRMRPFTNKLPKPLSEVGRCTLPERLRDSLKPHHMFLVLLSLRVLGCHLPNGLQHQEDLFQPLLEVGRLGARP